MRFNGVTYIDAIDVLRYLLQTVLFTFVLTEQVERKRKHFKKRLVTGCIGLLLFSCVYFFVKVIQMYLPNIAGVIFVTMLWWQLAQFAVFLLAYYCYETTFNNILYYGILVTVLEEVHTLLFQYWLCKKMFPDMMQENTVLYLVLLVGTTLLFAYLEYLFLGRNLKSKHGLMPKQIKGNVMHYLIIIVVMSLMSNATHLVFECSDGSAEIIGIDLMRHVVVPYYCIFVNLVVFTIILILHVVLYNTVVMEQEKNFLERLQKEREHQYEFNRENMDLINAKCHDLKHQIKALSSVQEADRERIFAEAEEAINFYDAFVKTGNNVLDTILTEKSLICAKHEIRFSCNTQVHHLEKVDVIDLYTILGNAIDNAFECVCRYEEKEKKIISLSVIERGDMLNIFVDNYFDGELQLKNGIPITSKADKMNHGYGVKSIRMIADKYDGDIRISNKNNTFSLQVMMKI